MSPGHSGTVQGRAALRSGLARAVAVLLLLFVFLLGVQGLQDGFKLLGRDLLDSFFTVTSNPFTALMVGILATTLVQSSSATTAMIVGLVAAPENPLPVANAVPMIMGANIGTTVTNTIVALAHMGRRDEFRRAFSVATCHDFFNFITVAILLPFELLTGYLQRAASLIAHQVGDLGGRDMSNPLKDALKAALAPIESLIGSVFSSPQLQGVVLFIVSGAIIFGALYMLVRVMRSAVLARVEVYVTRFLGRGGILAILVGIIVTVMVQSSSITTSLLVPLAGAGLITLEQAFPITLGANVGTTVTALIANLAITGPNAEAGVVIALVHLLFNLTGTLMIYPVRAIRRIPLRAAEMLAGVAVRSRRLALVYVVLLFYGLPALFALLNRWLGPS